MGNDGNETNGMVHHGQLGSQLVDGEYGEKRNPNSFQLDFATIENVSPFWNSYE